MTLLVYATASGASLVAGIFYAFSTIVMQALGRLRPREGIVAMQSINVVVINPLFFSGLLRHRGHSAWLRSPPLCYPIPGYRSPRR